jgi:HJR/Mrr/RecB family endonuclease
VIAKDGLKTEVQAKPLEQARRVKAVQEAVASAGYYIPAHRCAAQL